MTAIEERPGGETEALKGSATKQDSSQDTPAGYGGESEQTSSLPRKFREHMDLSVKTWITAGNPSEVRLLSLMTTDAGRRAVREAGIGVSLFEEPIRGAVFAWMLAQDGAVTPLMLEAEYPAVADEIPRPEDVAEPVDWLIDNLQRRYIVNQTQDIIRRSAKLLGDEYTKADGDPSAALRMLAEEAKAAVESVGRTSGQDGTPRLWNAADLTPATQPRWLAKNRLPRAAVSLLVGDEGIGKSLFWVYLAAAVTTGKPLLEFGVPPRDPGHVVIVVTEDDWSTTVRPRLEVAGADMAMVRVICAEADGSGAPEFPRDLHLIADADPTPVLVVVDAWLDTVPAKLSVKDPQMARQALHPWKDLATTTDAAVLLLTHTNRVASGQARDKYGATGELRKKARMTLFAQRDDDGNLVIGPDKANTAAAVMASRFQVRGMQHFTATEDHDGTVPRLTYVGETDQTAQQHIADAYTAGRGANSDDDPVIGWLATYLAGGPRWATDVYSAAEDAGFSTDQAKRAKKRLRVDSGKDGVTKAWFWRLPGQEGSPGDDQGSARECV